MKKLASLFGALTLVASSYVQASQINVGGVQWDPDAAAPLPDMSMDYFFYQWFTSSADAVTSAAGETPVMNTIDPTALSVGDTLTGIGEVSALNGNTAAINSIVGGDLCPNCELTLAFGGFEITSLNGGLLGGPTFANGWINFYVDNTPDFTPTDAGFVDPANATDGQLWLALEVTSNAFLSANPVSGTLALEFEAVGGLAQGNFDTNATFGGLSGGLVDAIANNSAIFNNFLDLNGDTVADYYANANGQLDGDSIPEPATLAVFGLGLLSIAGFKRRKQ